MKSTIATLLLIATPAFADDARPQTAPASTSEDDKPKQAKKETAARSIEPLSVTESVSVTQTAPEQTTKGVEVGAVRFELHGYARMPLSAQGTPREPYLVDNDYFLSGFAYTRLYEPDWSELFFSASHGNYKAEFGLFASLYSDYASARLENQLGVAQASVTAKKFLDHEPLTVQLGVFWDRFGHIEPYDTYIFGRTHQGGLKVSYQLPGNGRVQAGIGMHQAQLQQNLGLTPIAHVAGAYPVAEGLELGGYALRTWTRDKRQLSPIEEGTMWVAGADARYKIPGNRGTAYLAFGLYDMDKVLYLAPALEVMHSTGGRGLTENYLGTDSSDDGSGRMYTIATDVKTNVTDRIGARAFGMGTWVRSPQSDEMDPQLNKDRRLYLKWGVEPSFKVHPSVVLSARFDRVILDMYDSENSFRILSPRVTFPPATWGELFFMYSHYWYGNKVTLRPGQVPLETMPDSNVFKLQAQVLW
jgi:hypothetical protein